MYRDQKRQSNLQLAGRRWKHLEFKKKMCPGQKILLLFYCWTITTTVVSFNEQLSLRTASLLEMINHYSHHTLPGDSFVLCNASIFCPIPALISLWGSLIIRRLPLLSWTCLLQTWSLSTNHYKRLPDRNIVLSFHRSRAPVKTQLKLPHDKLHCGKTSLLLVFYNYTNTLFMKPFYLTMFGNKMWNRRGRKMWFSFYTVFMFILLRSNASSLLVSLRLIIFLADLEVTQLICLLVRRHHPEPVTQVVLLQVLLGEILQVPAGRTGS